MQHPLIQILRLFKLVLENAMWRTPYERKFKSRITSVVESLGIPITQIGNRSMQEAAFHAKDWQAQQK